MLKIRLARGGAKKKPHHRIVVAERASARDGKFVEKLGFFNPHANSQRERIQISTERLQYWQSKGAQLSERVAHIVAQSKLSDEQFDKNLAEKMAHRKKVAQAKKDKANPEADTA